MLKPIETTRARLYQELWTEPARVVARRYNVSDVALSKACRRYNIPKPPPGYWAQRDVGRALAAPPLAPAESPESERVVFFPQGPSVTYADTTECARERLPEWRIEVPDDARLSHPLVKKTHAAIADQLRPTRKRQDQYITRHRDTMITRHAGCLNIDMSREMALRALRILDALLSALEKRGFHVSIDRNGGTVVDVLGELESLRLREKLKQVTVRDVFGNRTDLAPTGVLHLIAGDQFSNAGVADKPGKPIEAQLNVFVSRLVRRALQAKRDRERYRERSARWRAHDLKRRKREQERLSERLRQRRLRQFSGKWHRYRRIVALVDAVEDRLHRGAIPEPNREDTARWVAWARDVASNQDPIKLLLEDLFPLAELPSEAWMPNDCE